MRKYIITGFLQLVITLLISFGGILIYKDLFWAGMIMMVIAGIGFGALTMIIEDYE